MSTTPHPLESSLPMAVRSSLAKTTPEAAQEFWELYARQKKDLTVAYLLWVIGLHYAYLRKWGLLVVFWITLGGLLLWWLVDAFRLPGLVRNYNYNVALDIMAKIKAIRS